ncbi:MAG: hypothetical protein IJ869_02980 [Clostridiales bacterium]|nr:hypothetical protein [Clostridiales bacterium]
MKLAGIFQDRMILQRDRENHIWGEDDKASQVTVTVLGKNVTADVKEGRFDVVIPPLKAAKDIDIEITGSETITLREVCFGDVFVLSGQSNMELPVYRTFDQSEAEIKASNYPYIRQYRLTPRRDYREDEWYTLPEMKWVSAVPGQIDEISAYGFFVFKELYDEMDIPFGLILNAQGGSSVAAWLPPECVKEYTDEYDLIEKYWGEGVLSGYLSEQEKRTIKWRNETRVVDPDVFSKNIPSETEEVTMPGLIHDITGAVWLYKEFESEEEVEDAFLYAGMLIDADATYINGHEVGRTEYMYPPRKYNVDPSFVKKGTNLIAIRLIAERESGGGVPFHPYYIRLNGKKTSLEGTWKLYMEKKMDVFVPGRMLICFPSILYKSSLLTLKNVSVKGFLWYQGESDTGNPEGYDIKFKAMVENVRAILGEDLPVVITELTDYIDPQSEDTSRVPDNWRSVQEQQLKVSETVPFSACVPARDLGDMYELHTQKKALLAARAVPIIKKIVYKQ